MAKVWKNCNAKSKGERRLAAHLSSLDDPRLILAFSLDFIPGGREIDLLLIHQDIGIFVVEVKAVGIDAIKSVSPSEWIIDQRATKENPVTQAYRQYEGLRDFLSPHFQRPHRLPFIAVTACLPLISRRQWSATFGHSVYAKEIADRILFEEDLYSGLPALIDRLRFIHKNPPVRQGAEARVVQDKFLMFLWGVMEPAKPALPTMSERERLAAIERGITSKVQEAFPPNAIGRAVFSGYPGTGKTFRLLSIGALHAYSGKRVLFVCFNKTLGSDIRRLLSFSDRLQASTYLIEVLDIFQLTQRCFDINGLMIDAANPDEWGKLVFEYLDRSDDPSIERYDTILIDEAQDMKAWHLDILGLHARPDSSVIIAMGQGQELYKNPASATDWLNAFTEKKGVRSHQLRRNFRNPREQYIFAQAFFDAWPTSFEKIDLCKKKLLGNSKQELLFDRPGDAPRYFSLPVREDEFDNHGQWQAEIVAEAFFDIIHDEYEEILKNENSHPVNLLILVPSPEGLHCQSARLALGRLCDERDVGYIDYTINESRRASASQNQIRLCTFHCARGLEGERVIVFGLEDVEKVALVAGAEPQNLAFVALSRGMFATTIAVRSAPRNAVHTLCERIFQSLA